MLARSWKQPVGGSGDGRGSTSPHNQQPRGHRPHSKPTQPQDHANNPDPPQQSLADKLHQLCDQLPSNDPIKKSYQQLLNHEEWPKNFINPHWEPFRNLVCFLLYIGWEDKSLGMSVKMLDWIINLLLTLQQENIIDDEYFIPRDHSTILKYKRWFPDPPVC